MEDILESSSCGGIGAETGRRGGNEVREGGFDAQSSATQLLLERGGSVSEAIAALTISILIPILFSFSFSAMLNEEHRGEGWGGDLQKSSCTKSPPQLELNVNSNSNGNQASIDFPSPECFLQIDDKSKMGGV